MSEVPVTQSPPTWVTVSHWWKLITPKDEFQWNSPFKVTCFGCEHDPGISWNLSFTPAGDCFGSDAFTTTGECPERSGEGWSLGRAAAGSTWRINQVFLFPAHGRRPSSSKPLESRCLSKLKSSSASPEIFVFSRGKLTLTSWNFEENIRISSLKPDDRTWSVWTGVSLVTQQ